MYKKEINKLIYQINEDYSDKEVDTGILLDLKEAISKVADSPSIASALFKFFSNTVNELKDRNIYLNEYGLNINTEFPYYVLKEFEENGEAEEVEEAVIDILDEYFLVNAHINNSKVGDFNSKYNGARVRKGKFNARPYVQRIIKLIQEGEIKVECYFEDLDDIRDEWERDEWDMIRTRNDRWWWGR